MTDRIGTARIYLIGGQVIELRNVGNVEVTQTNGIITEWQMKSAAGQAMQPEFASISTRQIAAITWEPSE